jgi:hypothetical protein
MLLLSTLHSDPALALVIIFGGVLGSLLAISGPSKTPVQTQQRQRRN